MKHAVVVKHKMHTCFSVTDQGSQKTWTKITGRIDSITCLHAEADPYAKGSDEECQRDETRWRWTIPLIRYGQDRNHQHSGCEKLETCELMQDA